MRKKYLDTYALIEITKGNPNFAKYFSQDFTITNITLVEFYAVLLREENEKTADYWFKKLEPYSVNIKTDVLVEAVKFKYKHRKQKISFFDAVGYIYSLKNNCLFVTGDKEFKHLNQVEFIK